MKSPRERFWEKVDKSGGPDACWLWTGAGRTGRPPYGFVRIGGRTLRAHRISFTWQFPDVDISDLTIDHMCHNTLCVNPSHLQAVTVKENGENRAGAPSNNTSGVRGVSWNIGCNKWQAYVTHSGKRVYLGVFEQIDDARSVVIEARNELFTNNLRDRSGSWSA